MNRKFNSYEEFYKFYLKEHSRPATRIFHCLGTLLGLTLLFFALCHQSWKLGLGAVFSGYAIAWTSHFFIEKNRPATIKYPLLSFVADFRMLFDTLRGKIPLDRRIKE